jgi:hypothetical protein
MSWLETDLQVRPVGDISGDSTVDGLDFSMFAGQWLSVKELGFSRFIGPEDCPGVSQFADPYVFKENDAFYLTSTYTVGTPMYMFSTTDFLGKERYTLNLDLNESYLRGYFSDPGLVAYHVWGFVPYKHTDNSWHAYASIHIGSSQTFVCHLSPDGSSTWPIMDWRLDKVLAGSPSDIAYESKIYSDASGLYLLYVDTLGDGNNHIMAQKKLDPDDVDTSFTPRAILSPEGLRSEDRTPPGGMQIVEGQNIAHVVDQSGSKYVKYVMFYSVGDYAESNYKLGVAYSDVLIPSAGQYEKPKNFDSLNVWENPSSTDEVVYTLQTQISEWPNYYADLFNGPGLGNLVEVLDRYYIVFHARDPGQTGSGDGRWTWICPASVDFSEPIHSWVVPKLPNPELIKNASFESNFGSGTEPIDWNKDFNCWGAYDGASVSGSWCLHPGDGGPPGGAYQDIITLSGKWYEMSLWIQNFDGAAGTGNVKVLIGSPGSQNYFFENGTDKTRKFSLTGLLDMNFSTGIPWTQVNFSFQATGPVTRIGVYNAPFSGGFSTNVDDVSVKALNE